jgi:hypothetical protein
MLKPSKNAVNAALKYTTSTRHRTRLIAGAASERHPRSGKPVKLTFGDPEAVASPALLVRLFRELKCQQ